MLAGIRSRLTYANVMASIAVFVALGLGTAVAISGRAENGATRIDFKGSATDPAPSNVFEEPAAHRILRLHELTVRASCIDTGTNTARIFVAFGSSVKAGIEWGFIQFNDPGTTTETTGANINDSWYPVIDRQGGLRAADGQVTYRNSQRTITVSLHAHMNGADSGGFCTVRGTALNAPE